MKKFKILNDSQFAVLVLGTLCFMASFFSSSAYKDKLVNTSLLFLGVYIALRTVESYIRRKKRQSDDLITTEDLNMKLYKMTVVPYKKETSTVGCMETIGKNRLSKFLSISSNPGEDFNHFEHMYDVLGKERKDFVEKLSALFTLVIVEENDTHIRIAYKEKHPVFINADEQQKLYADFINLINSMKDKIEMRRVRDN